MSSGSMDKGKLKKLNLLLDQSKAFSQIIAKSLLPTPDASSPSSSESTLKGEQDASDDQLNTYGQPAAIQNVVLKSHQLQGLNWLVNLYQNGLNGILADEMGLGKTLQTIALIAFLKEQKIHGPYLVVAPLNVVTNWAMEFQKFAPSLKVLPYVGPKDHRKKLRSGGWKRWDVIITSYELSMVDFNVLKRYQWTYLVVDEGHRLKNFKSQLFTKLKELNCSNRLLLTGTPLQNNLVELWALLNFILPTVFHDFHTFKNYFNFEEFEKLKDDDDNEITDDKDDEEMNTLINLSMKKALVSNLHTILKPFILRRLKKDVLKLPPKREYIVYSKHTSMQMNLYKGFLDTSCHIGLKVGSTRKVLEREQAARHVRMTLIETFLPIYVKYNVPYLLPKVDDFIKLLRIENQLEQTKEVEIVNGLDLLMKRKKRRNQVNYNEDLNSYGKIQKRQTKVNEIQLSPIYPYYEALLKHFKAKSVLNPLPLLRQVCDSPYLLCWPWQEEPRKHIVLSDSEIEDILSDQEHSNDDEDDFDLTDEMKVDRFNDIVTNTAKLQTLESLIPAILKRNPNERILVFSQFIKTLKVLRIYFEDHPLFTDADNDIFPQKTLVLHGAHSVGERNDLFDIFSKKDQHGKLNGPQIFLLSTKAANLGLNLTIASTVILYDCDYNPTVDAQAIARVHRIGQTKECLIYRLVSQATVEEVVVRKGEGKTWLADVVVESGGFDGKVDKTKEVDNEATPESKDIKFNDKDSLMMTLYRLYKLVNRNGTIVAIKDNKLSETELAELTNKDHWDPECEYKEQAKIELPHVRMFADSNIESNSDEFVSFV